MSFFKVTGASVGEIACLTRRWSLGEQRQRVQLHSCKSTDTDLLDSLWDYWKWSLPLTLISCCPFLIGFHPWFHGLKKKPLPANSLVPLHSHFSRPSAAETPFIVQTTCALLSAHVVGLSCEAECSPPPTTAAERLKGAVAGFSLTVTENTLHAQHAVLLTFLGLQTFMDRTPQRLKIR